jgi:hypothetical protein
MDDFVHIPKTSGSSLRTILARQYGVNHISYFEPGIPQLRGRDAVSVLKEDMAARKIDLITGHHTFGVHAALHKPLRYFSILRDPISRPSSDYFFAYSYKHHRLRDEILSCSLTPEAFLIDGNQAGRFDAQCSLMSGRVAAAPDIAGRAFETIKRCFVVVGVAELFTESILFMAKRLGWKPPLYVTRNVTRLLPEIERARSRIEEKVRAGFADRYAADSRLHELVKAKLRQDIQAEGAPFASALEAFREMQTHIEKSNEANKYDQYEFAATDRLPDVANKLTGSEPYRILQDYLRASEVSAAHPRNYVGHVDVIAGRTVSGWAADLFSDEPIEVRIYRSGSQIGTALARNERPDVKSVCGIRSNVGFTVYLDSDIVKEEFSVCFEDTSLTI